MNPFPSPLAGGDERRAAPNPLQTLDDAALAALALATLDLTSLRGDEDDDAIDALVEKAAHPAGPPAALCVFPFAVARARRQLDARGLSRVRVATVVAFPHGDASPRQVAHEVEQALAEGADEIDMVLPWRALQAAALGLPLEGLSRASAEAAARAVVLAAREAAPDRPLKVILESGELGEAALIDAAARIALEGGADFIKTSTGKARVHATPPAVAVMLAALERQQAAGGPARGLKVAGGVQTLDDVRLYLSLGAAAFGPDALTSGRWRFGASSLWPVLVAALAGPDPGCGSLSAAGGARTTGY